MSTITIKKFPMLIRFPLSSLEECRVAIITSYYNESSFNLKQDRNWYRGYYIDTMSYAIFCLTPDDSNWCTLNKDEIPETIL